MRGSIMKPLTLLAWLSLQPVWAQSPARLLPPEQGARLADTPIHIQLNDAPDGTLTAELDEIDVTELLQRTGNRLTLRPPKALTPGTHTLRLTVETVEGELLELGQWNFKVRQSAVFDTLEGSWQGSATLSRTLSASPRTGIPDWSGEGALSVRGKAARGQWRAEGSADISYASAAPGGDQAELPRYLLTFQRKPLSLTAGHQAMLNQSLISDGLTHRGVRVDLNTPGGLPLSARLFTSRPDSISRFGNTLGVDDDRNRVFGGSVRTAPIAGHPTLQVEAGAYEGRITDPNTRWEQDGSGWQVALSDQLLDKRLTLRGELAGSRWDADGRGTLARPLDDRAFRLNASYGIRKSAWQWLLQADYGRVGPWFVSLLNPTGEVDQQGGRLAAAFAHGNWQGALSWQSLEDNVDNDPALLTTQVEDQRAQLGYRFTRPWGHVLDSLDLTLWRQNRNPKRIPTGYSGTPADDLTQGLSLQAGLKVHGVTGQLVWEHSWLDDRRLNINDADTDSWQLALQRRWRLPRGRTFTLAPSWQRGETRYTRANLTVRSETAAVDLTTGGWLGDRLQLALSPAWSREQDPLYGVDTSGHSLSGSLDLRLRENGRLPLSVGLTGDWQRLHDRLTDTTTESWQLSATLRLQWD